MYEYKVVPAPQRARRIKGLKNTADRFAHALAERINAEATGGWQFLRTETMPCEERSAFGRAKTSMQTVMVFQRGLAASDHEAARAPQRAEPEHYESYEASDYDDEDIAQDDLQSLPDTTPDAYAPEAPARPAPSRQEPLFRAGAMLHGDRAGRAEPALRTPHRDDE